MAELLTSNVVGTLTVTGDTRVTGNVYVNGSNTTTLINTLIFS